MRRHERGRGSAQKPESTDLGATPARPRFRIAALCSTEPCETPARPRFGIAGLSGTDLGATPFNLEQRVQPPTAAASPEAPALVN